MTGPSGAGPPEGDRPRLLVVLGPTGTGKSSLALELARRLGGEIVGCDALQVYRGFDVATAKPSAAARAEIPHHLVDWLDPARDDATMAGWVAAAERAVAAIAERGRVPIVAGGTGLYLRGLLRGVILAPARQPELRRRLARVTSRRGVAWTHRWLARRDPASAARLHPGDRQRVLRALELSLLPGESWSRRLEAAGTWEGGARAERYPSLKIGLDMDREALARRLDRRVDGFFEAGLAAEVRRLLAGGVPASANAFRAIGYREVVEALHQGAGLDALEEAREAVRCNTRRYAKRQRTWFRREPDVVWLDAARPPGELASEVISRWRAGAVSEPSEAHGILAGARSRTRRAPGSQGRLPRCERGTQMDVETRNLQNDFFNTARKERAIVTVFLSNGKKLTGKIRSFDKFTVLLETQQGEQMIFKHAISTVSAPGRSASAHNHDEAPDKRRVESAPGR